MDKSKARKFVWTAIILLVIAVSAFRIHTYRHDETTEGRGINTFSERGITLSASRVDVSEMPENIPVEVTGVGIHPDTGSAAVFLVTEDGKAYLPVFIGPFEADAISRSLEGIKPQRPLTHELFSEVIGVLGGEIKKVVVSSLENGTFNADLVLETSDGESGYIDARPSDSIALALFAGAEISVATSVMEQAGYKIEEDEDIPQQPHEEPGPPEAPQPPADDLI